MTFEDVQVADLRGDTSVLAYVVDDAGNRIGIAHMSGDLEDHLSVSIMPIGELKSELVELWRKADRSLAPKRRLRKRL